MIALHRVSVHCTTSNTPSPLTFTFIPFCALLAVPRPMVICVFPSTTMIAVIRAMISSPFGFSGSGGLVVAAKSN